MPIGNGDIALNVWVEPSGEIGLYIGKSDSLSEKSWGSFGLLKVGGLHLSLSPSPLVPGAPFAQVLKLREGEIQINEGSGDGAVQLRIWVDANHPVVRIEAKGSQPHSFKVTLNNWRSVTQERGDISADTVLADQKDSIAWYHRNGPKADVPMLNLTFGAVIKGAGLVTQDATTLKSSAPTASQMVSIYPLTSKTDTADEWLKQLSQQIAQVDGLNLEQTRLEHQKWWAQFWNRSWISVQGDQAATDVTRGYVLQRFITACAGRGADPVHFDGSLFTVDNPTYHPDDKQPPGVNPDYRDWGAHYWMQNTRPIYWPLLATGDFDMMQPFFKMYAGMIPLNTAKVREFYGHDGAYIREENFPWGGLTKILPEDKQGFTTHYYTPILELSAMMLDYYEYTGDKKFAKETLLPVATAGLLFFDQHFGRDAQGKILIQPANAIEMYWKVSNPAPDIAGLHSVLPRMIALPDGIVSAQQRAAWQEMLGRIPKLPMGTKKGMEVLLPYTGPQTATRHNDENPELYAIYPFHLYGVHKPDFNRALNSFALRRVNDRKGSWYQDCVQAALVGLADQAKEGIHFNSLYVNPGQKFPAFWEKMNSYVPGQENGGNLQNALQKMILQADGRKLLLLPAWPKEWSAEFKLHAPFQTTVEGTIKEGKLVGLKVTPRRRAADVIDLSKRPPITVPAIPAATSPFAIISGEVKTILSPTDPIVALRQTEPGTPNNLTASVGGEGVALVVDGKISSKHRNGFGDKDGNNQGVNSGFAITPQNSGSTTALQIATAGDNAEQDPLTITVEGSNAPDALAEQGNGFTKIYEGSTGLENDPGRSQWGPIVKFKNAVTYKTYRILVTSTREPGSIGTQYSEVRLGNVITP
jgi:hypothetical protein